MHTTCIGDMGLRPSPGRSDSWSFMIPTSTHSTKPDLVQIHRATVSDMEAVAAVLRDAFLEFKSLYTKSAYAETTADPDMLRRRLDEARSGPQDCGAKSSARFQRLRSRTAYTFAAQLCFRWLAEIELPGCS